MNQLLLRPIERIDGAVRLPGSKSLSNRALLLSSLAAGQTRLHNLLHSHDTDRMLDALQQLHVDFDLNSNGTDCTVTGLGRLFTPESISVFSLGNAGTAIRPLTSMLSLCPGTFTIDGD